jgi:hypothetical protein
MLFVKNVKIDIQVESALEHRTTCTPIQRANILTNVDFNIFNIQHNTQPLIYIIANTCILDLHILH